MVEPGLVMFWFGSDLFYANAAFFSEQAHELIDESPTPVRWFVIDATAITGLDFSAGRALTELHQDLAKAGIVLALIVVQVRRRGDLDRMGIIEMLGAHRVFDTRQACVAAYRAERAKQDSSPANGQSPSAAA
jgi:MFS superfamily sulfate permease-like transporter